MDAQILGGSILSYTNSNGVLKKQNTCNYPTLFAEDNVSVNITVKDARRYLFIFFR